MTALQKLRLQLPAPVGWPMVSHAMIVVSAER
jgi:hypothetical protein